MTYYLLHVNSIPSPQTKLLISNTEEDIMETVIFARRVLIFNSQNSIASMRWYPQLRQHIGENRLCDRKFLIKNIAICKIFFLEFLSLFFFRNYEKIISNYIYFGNVSLFEMDYKILQWISQ